MKTPSFIKANSRLVLLIQLLGSLFILATGLGNVAKLLALSLLWLITFWPIRPLDMLLFVFASVFFTLMNTLSLQQGIFRFTNPDLLGMPAYELAMWGFYSLHTYRFLRGPIPANPTRKVWILVLLYAGAFAVITDPYALLIATSILLFSCLTLHHEPLDWAYVGYMVILGAAIEYVGTSAGQWSYPSPPMGGVPLWFVTLWGGVGFFLRRLMVPLLTRIAPNRTPSGSLSAPDH